MLVDRNCYEKIYAPCYVTCYVASIQDYNGGTPGTNDPRAAKAARLRRTAHL